MAGRRFDRIVANPPFVVSSGQVEHSYRDSGLDLDGASKLMISQAVDHLNPGGTASILASWVHVEGQDWRARVASWLPAHGVDAWIVQRDVADPALYIGTWLRDGDADQRDPAVAVRAEKWFDHFELNGVEGVGFGFVYLRRTDEPSDVLAEDLRHAFTDALGPESIDYFSRLQWLRDHDVSNRGSEYAPTPHSSVSSCRATRLDPGRHPGASWGRARVAARGGRSCGEPARRSARRRPPVG